MPPKLNIIQVKILPSTAPGVKPVLDVDETGNQNVVHKNQEGTLIRWILSEAQAQFASMDGTDPAFEWLEQPPAGLFGTPEVKGNGNHLEMMDNNTKNGPASIKWIYKLRVIKDGTIYTTTSDYDRRIGIVSNNPVIINKDP